jgi:hypothetical protein
MGLFDKFKKDKGGEKGGKKGEGKAGKDPDKTEVKSKGKRKVQDRFMQSALSAKFAGAKSNDMLEFEFTETFSEERVKKIGSMTDRKLLGRGEFDKTYQKLKDVTRKYAPYISGTESPSDEKAEEMILAFTELESLASAWMLSSEGKWTGKDEDRKDYITQAKEIEARGALKGARITKFQLLNRKKLHEPETTAKIEELERARAKLDLGGAAALEAYRSADAEVMLAVCGTTQQKNGTSVVRLINGPDGDIAYAFKSVAGESEMMGTAKGSGAAREVLMSQLCEQIATQTGLRMPWPKATMARVEGEVGAMIDGVAGTKFAAEADYEAVPAKALQQILLCNLAGGQFDIKWEDQRFTRDGAELEPTCMDGGAAMPDAFTATTFMAQMGNSKPGDPIVIKGSTGQPYPEAMKPLDKELVDGFLKIDTVALRKQMLTQAQALEVDHGLGVATLALDSGIGTAITSIEGIQKILHDSNGQISLIDFKRRYDDEVIRAKLVEPNLPDWSRLQRSEYRRLNEVHGGLFNPIDDDTDMGPVYAAVLHPAQIKLLDELAALSRPASAADALRAFGTTVPVEQITEATVKDFRKASEAVAAQLPSYERLMQKYPGAIRPKESFDSLAQAYAEVVSQEGFLASFSKLAARIGKAENTEVTVAQVLRRYGHSVPTSNFRDKYRAVPSADKSGL